MPMNSRSMNSNNNLTNGQDQEARSQSFPVVGIGASAGGLEAFTQLLRTLPPKPGAAFVFIQHLDPTRGSILTALLSKETTLPVREVTDGMSVEPNHVYVLPPNRDLTISHSRLKLAPRTETRGQHMVIDHFFRSLAEGQGSSAIGVILSGTASDGTLGLAAIKAEGGITFAQDEKSARYDGMPRSAIAAGCVDFVLSPEEIAAELARIGSHPYVTKPEAAVETVHEGEAALRKIFLLLRNATGVDFSNYRRTTINRRVIRRMLVHKIETTQEYVKYLRENPDEIQALYQDMLINVTSFFRNPEAFEALKTSVFPHIVQRESPTVPIRIWAPGCSSGEETYSLAISILEFLGDAVTSTSVQLFGTDLSDAGIEKARAGIYPENIQADVSPERLRRFFIKTEKGYQINKAIRDMCVFARQNIFMDPPFSQLDLVSCRNLLIYMEPVLQKKVLPILHYALKETGFLLLGGSEGVSSCPNLFSPVDKKHKIFAKKATLVRPHFEFPTGLAAKGTERMIGRKTSASNEGGGNTRELLKEVDRILLTEYAPAGVVVDGDLDVVQFRGRTGPYLEPAPGNASLSLLKMAREGLLFDLRAAIEKAKKDRVTVTRENVQVVGDDQTRNITLRVIPLKSAQNDQRLLILFDDRIGNKSVTENAVPPAGSAAEGENPLVVQLRQELAATKEYLQSMVEAEQASKEELQSANEEILSSNEELQSTNEELETAKEELQSSNEELNTVNEELRNRNIELSQAHEYAQAMNERLFLAQRAGNIAAWEWFPDTGEIKWSDNAGALHGWGSKRFDLNYEQWLKLVHPEDRERVRTQRAQALQGKEYDIEYRIVRPDGRVRWLGGRGEVHLAEPGKPLHMIGTQIDITSRKAAEESLRNSDKLAATGRLAAVFAHEINNPAESLMNLLYLLENNPTLNEAGREQVKMAWEEMNRIILISRQTLGLYRESPAPVKVNLPQLIDEILQLSAPKIQAGGLQVEKYYNYEGEILAFPGELRQVFVNLISNALETLREGGVLKVRVSGSRDWRNPKSRGVRVLISDNGPGIPSDYRHKIFEPFFTTKNEKGTGLGLWVTQGIIHKHNGSIRLRSSVLPGRSGTCFSVFLPNQGILASHDDGIPSRATSVEGP